MTRMPGAAPKKLKSSAGFLPSSSARSAALRSAADTTARAASFGWLVVGGAALGSADGAGGAAGTGAEAAVQPSKISAQIPESEATFMRRYLVTFDADRKWLASCHHPFMRARLFAASAHRRNNDYERRRASATVQPDLAANRRQICLRSELPGFKPRGWGIPLLFLS
jgi:hypothetical protein